MRPAPSGTQRPSPAPNVDTVASRPAPAPLQVEDDPELDRFADLESITLSPGPSSAPAARGSSGPYVTRMVEPDAMPRPVQAGPTGPNPEAVGAVRRAMDARQESRTRLRERARDEGVDAAAGSVPSRDSASPQARHGTTVSQATLDQYSRRGQLLFDRYRRELGLDAGPDEVSPVEFVNWALSLKPGLSSSTWRMYRQCLYHFLSGYPSYETGQAVELLDRDVVDRSRPEQPVPPKGEKPDRRSSALKEKRFPEADYDRVQIYLRTFNRSRLAPILADWLRAGILTALRPVEWKACDLEVQEDARAAYGRRAYLYVLSAKATNERSTGLVRTLDISAFPDAELATVRRMVDHAREWLEGGRYSEVQGQCSGLLYAAAEKMWPTRKFHYSLYSCRHQAIANWKALPLDPAAIAAIVGHGVTSTAAEHYGKRRTSWPPAQIPAPPRPVPEELAVVRDRIRLFERRLELEVRAGLRKPGDVPDFPVG